MFDIIHTNEAIMLFLALILVETGRLFVAVIAVYRSKVGDIRVGKVMIHALEELTDTKESLKYLAEYVKYLLERQILSKVELRNGGTSMESDRKKFQRRGDEVSPEFNAHLDELWDRVKHREVSEGEGNEVKDKLDARMNLPRALSFVKPS